jgi:sulfoxide reductase heme-binding subunit YedZ
MYLALYCASYIAAILIGIFFNLAPLANILGILALLCYIATLLPSLLRAIFPASKGNNTLMWLLKYRRHLGVAAFNLGANHGILLIIERHANLLDCHTYTHYFQGISTLAIFTILTVTSNDESVKILKKNWRKLHQLTYLAIFILPWHILDKMSGHWTYLTPLAVLLTLVILILFLRRKWLEIFESKPAPKLKTKPVEQNFSATQL